MSTANDIAEMEVMPNPANAARAESRGSMPWHETVSDGSGEGKKRAVLERSISNCERRTIPSARTKNRYGKHRRSLFLKRRSNNRFSGTLCSSLRHYQHHWGMGKIDRLQWQQSV